MFKFIHGIPCERADVRDPDLRDLLACQIRLARAVNQAKLAGKNTVCIHSSYYRGVFDGKMLGIYGAVEEMQRQRDEAAPLPSEHPLAERG